MRDFGRPALWAVWVVVALAGCSAPPGPEGGPVTTGPAIEQVAWDAIAAGAVVIDVRTDAEFREGHLPGATHIPYDQIVARRAELPADRDGPIVLYCRSGRRSGIARQTLVDLGFTHAINAGGYDALMRARPH